MKKITGDAEEKGNLGQFPFPDIQELHTERWRGGGLLCLTFLQQTLIFLSIYLSNLMSWTFDVLNYKFCYIK